MSSIIKAGRMLATAVVLALVWYAAMAVLFRLSEQAPAALVLFPERYLSAQNLPEGIFILKWNSGFAILGSENVGYVERLYAAGFPLVFPARTSGCLAYRPLK